MTRDDVVAAARTWIGVPWRDKGRGRLGLDCIGLPAVLALEFGVPHEDVPDYSRSPDGVGLLTRLRRYTRIVPADGDLTGCIGVVSEVTLPAHVGIFARLHGARSFIHVIKADGCREDIWRREDRFTRLIMVRAFPGLDL